MCKGPYSEVRALRAEQQQFGDSGRLPATPLALQRTPDQNEQLFEVSEEIVSFCEASRVNSLSIGHFATVLRKHIISAEERQN